MTSFSKQIQVIRSQLSELRSLLADVCGVYKSFNKTLLVIGETGRILTRNFDYHYNYRILNLNLLQAQKHIQWRKVYAIKTTIYCIHWLNKWCHQQVYLQIKMKPIKERGMGSCQTSYLIFEVPAIQTQRWYLKFREVELITSNFISSSSLFLCFWNNINNNRT